MKFIKLGIISIVAFALLITLISFFFPSHVRISKAIDINTEKDSLLYKLSDPYQWKQWYPGGDTLDILTVDGKAKGLYLDSLQGIAITEVTDSTVVSHKVGPFTRDMVSGWNVLFSGRPNTYTVQWYMDFKLGWLPWEKFSGLLLEKRYGPTMEKGLDNLKRVLEIPAQSLDSLTK